MKKIMSTQEIDVLLDLLAGIKLEDILKAINKTETSTGEKVIFISLPRLYISGLPCMFLDIPHGAFGCYVPEKNNVVELKGDKKC